MSPRMRLVLRDQWDDSAIAGVFSDNGCRFIGEEAGDRHSPRQLLWERGRARFHYVEDPITGLRFLMVAGEEVEQEVGWLEQRFEPLSREEIVDRFARARSPEDKAAAMFLAAVSASPDSLDPEVFSLLHEGLKDGDPYVRFQAVGAMSYLGWVEFLPSLEQLRDGDPDEQVSDVAEGLIELLAQTRRQSGA